MENNDFQKDVNNVAENVKPENGKVKKSANKEKRKTVVLIVILLVLMLITGVLAGIFISGNGKMITDNIEKVTEKKEENKTSKKIDESKPWVYDAEYMKENKKIYSDSKKTEEYACNSNKDLVVPYININSDNAKKINEKIKELYDEYYEKYGKEKTTPYSGEFKTYYHYELKYDKYINDNILSVIITLHEGETVVDGGTGGGVSTTYTYNFNLDTLNEASLDEMAVKCGFSSGNAVISKINDWEKKQKDILAKADDSDIFVGVQTNKYIIDGNGKLNFLYRTSTSATFDHLQPIENGKEIEIFYTEEQAERSKESKKNETDQTSKTNFSFMANEGFKNVTYQSERKNGERYYKITFDTNGNPTIYAETVGVENTSLKLDNSAMYNVKKDVAAGTVYVTFDYEGIGGSGEIRYSNVSDNSSIYLKLLDGTNNSVIELKKAQAKIIKQLSPSGWAGSSMQEVRLFDNGDVYYVTYNGEGNTEDNVIISELIAKNAETIEEKRNGQAIEAIIVKGKNLNILKNNESWILFENN